MEEPDSAGSRKSVNCPKLNGNLTLAGFGLWALGSWTCPNARPKARGQSQSQSPEPPEAESPKPRACHQRLVAAVLHLSERLVDEPLVVLFRQVSLDDLRRNHD